MTVDISSELEGLIEAKVSSGLYASPSDVVREALRLLDERDEVRRNIAEGASSLRDGEGADADAVFLKLERELDAMERAHAGG